MAAMAASTASSSIGLRKNVLRAVTCVQITKATTAAPVTGATRRATRPERSRMSPVVFRHRNVAPCSRQISTRVTPVSSAYGCSRSQNDPVYSWLELMGSPCSKSPSATPISSGASMLAPVSRPSQVRRQRMASRLPRYSKDTPRTISATSSSTSARYKPENIVAYQPGNAANIEAPATISQTSLPSHSGPIVLMAARRPASSLPTRPCSMPTPKSNPSRTKNPVHRTVMTMNQNGTSLIAVPLVLDGRHGRVHLGLGAGGRKLLAGVLQHQHQVDRRQRAVQQHEHRQADHQGGGADRRRDP